MANSRTVRVLSQAVGEPRDGEQDTITVDVTYWKGRGYQLMARAQKNALDGGSFSYYPMTGISHREELEQAKRFSRKKLEAIAAGLRESEKLATIAEGIQAQMELRIATGESF